MHEVLLAAGPLEGLSISEILAEVGGLGNDVEPSEGWDFLDLQGLGLEGGVRDGSSSSVDLGSVVRREVGSVANEWVARCDGSAGWASASSRWGGDRRRRTSSGGRGSSRGSSNTTTASGTESGSEYIIEIFGRIHTGIGCTKC